MVCRYWRLNRQPERHHPPDTNPELTFKKFCKVVRELDVGEQLTDWVCLTVRPVYNVLTPLTMHTAMLVS